MLKLNIVPIFVLFKLSNAGILLWGSQQIQFPTLKHFSDDDLTKLVEDLNSPKLVAFQSESAKLSENVPVLLNNIHTAYIPNANVNLEEVTVLSGTVEENGKIIQEILSQYVKEGVNNILGLMIFPTKRFKREVETPIMESPENLTYEVPKGPVLYNAIGKAMIYSSRPPILNTNSTSYTLGESSLVTLDKRDTYFKLSVTLPLEDDKVILRFKFPWSNGYWSLTSVEVVFIHTEGKYNLNVTNKVIGASSHFSYHCFGQTIFQDVENNIELILFEIQVQPDTVNGRFSDASDCVLFMTVPIWSGLIVTFMLIIALFLGLSALGSIKTMDKFDNYKTKQLNVTIAE